MTQHRIDRETTILIVVDLQERLLNALPRSEAIFERATFLVEAAKLLDVPVLATEQYPKGLGPTLPRLRERLPNAPFEKTAFSILGCGDLRAELERLAKSTVVLIGAESHVCIMQSAFDLLDLDHRVVIAADAVGSRFECDCSTALDRMRQAGAVVTTVEAIAFEWLVDAKHPAFKSVSALVRSLTGFPSFPQFSGAS